MSAMTDPINDETLPENEPSMTVRELHIAADELRESVGRTAYVSLSLMSLSTGRTCVPSVSIRVQFHNIPGGHIDQPIIVRGKDWNAAFVKARAEVALRKMDWALRDAERKLML